MTVSDDDHDAFPGSCEVSEESDTESEKSGEVILPLRDPQYIVIGKANITNGK